MPNQCILPVGKLKLFLDFWVKVSVIEKAVKELISHVALLTHSWIIYLLLLCRRQVRSRRVLRDERERHCVWKLPPAREQYVFQVCSWVSLYVAKLQQPPPPPTTTFIVLLIPKKEWSNLKETIEKKTRAQPFRNSKRSAISFSVYLERT